MEGIRLLLREKAMVSFKKFNFGRIGFAFLIISFMFVSYNKNAIWKNDEVLWMDTAYKSPLKARPRNYLGAAYGEKGLIDAAIKEFVTALSLPSSLHYYHHFNLGIAYKKKYPLGHAVDEFLSAIKLKPDYWEAYYHLGLTYVEIGRLEDAEENIKKALELQQLKSGKSDLHDELGNVYLMQGKYSDAINEYEKAVNLDKNNVEAIYDIAMAYEKVGNKEKAVESYKKFIEISPPDYKNLQEIVKNHIKELEEK